MRGFGRTMGQDQAGHAPKNPPDAPKVSARQVKARAEELGIAVRRGDYLGHGRSRMFISGYHGTWWRLSPNGVWLTLAVTNYLALQGLGGLKASR